MENIQKRYELLKPIMNERFRRLWSAAEAKVIGHGGIGLVSKATGQSRTTISNGIKELDTTDKIDIEGVRKSGGGRKKIIDKTPEVEAELLQLIEPTVSGEPESPILWTIKSLRNISEELGKRGYNISRNRVAELLKKNDFSLQANRKTDEGKSHPDRDAQFQYIHDKVIEFQSANQPVTTPVTILFTFHMLFRTERSGVEKSDYAEKQIPLLASFGRNDIYIVNYLTAWVVIAAALAYIFIIYFGILANHNDHVKKIHRGDRCDLSLFTLGLRLLEYLLNHRKKMARSVQLCLFSN